MFKHALARRHFATAQRSPHTLWYAQIAPSMIPIALLGSTVYIALQLLQTHLARERYLDDARARVLALEKELDDLRRMSHVPKEKKQSARSWFS